MLDTDKTPEATGFILMTGGKKNVGCLQHLDTVIPLDEIWEFSTDGGVPKKMVKIMGFLLEKDG